MRVRNNKTTRTMIGKSPCILTLFLVLSCLAVHAGTTDKVYAIGTGTRNIYTINADGTSTVVFTNYGATASSAAAQRPTDGMIFFITQAVNGAVFTWNPATPATAPVQIGTAGAGISVIPRLAFSPGGILYAIDSTTQNLYTINTTNGAASVAAVLSGVPANTTGDIAFGPDGTLYLGAGQNLYTVPVGGGAVTNLGVLGSFGKNILGMAFDQTGTLQIVDDNNPGQIYSVSLTTLVATKFTNRTSVTQGDLAGAPRVQMSGTIFEDVNYGGGAGRSLASSSGVGRPNARVELYDSTGAFLNSTLTDATGKYTFLAVPGQTYTVRAVNSTVTSSRPGALGTLIGVQTFRTSGISGTTGTADSNRAGGEDPTKIDSGNGSTTLTALTTGTLTPQSITPVTIPTSAVTGIDFGFNFDTIVSTRDTGQGSLRQFITNSNALTNTGLAQSGQAAGVEASIFMISNGTAVSGLRSGLTNQLNASGVASIVVASQLPAITDTNTLIDGTQQTTNVGDTNPGTLGVGGTVGVDALSLPTVNRPEVQISAARGTIGIGIQISANNTTVRGLDIFGFGTAANSAGSANIEIESGFTGTLIELNVLGTTAAGFTDPGAATRSIGDNIYSNNGKNGTIQKNLMGFAEGKGMGMEAGSSGWLVQQNEVRGNGINNSNLDGIDVENSSAHTIAGNLFIANWGTGIDSFQGTGSNVITNNTVTGNGVGTTAGLETMGIRIYGSSNNVTKNIVSSNVGSGISVTSGASTTVISQNSIFSNGTGAKGIGIDLQSATDDPAQGTAPYVSLNDLNDADTGGNGLLNYPILQTATISGGNLTITGFARPGSAIELFIAAPDPSGFGQGQTYLTTLTEGSAADLDAGTGTYGPAAINGIAQGTDTTNKFKFVIPVPIGVSIGKVITSTATLTGATSEFSGNVTVAAGPTAISGKVYLDVNHNGTPDSSEDWTGGATVFVNLVSGGAVVQSTSVPSGTGVFTFSNVAAGTYTIVVTNTATSTAVAAPAGYSFVNPTTGQLQVTVANTSINNENFGLFKGSLVQGKVFKDIGNGGGTANNGILDGAEAGLSGIAVRATDGGATVFDQALTAADGSYTLFITPGATTVVVAKTNPSGMIATGASVGNTSGTYNRTADTITFTKAGEGIFTGVNFGVVPLNTFQADDAQQGLPGATLFYPHIFTPGTAGQVTFTLASTASPANVGFGRVLYQDTNCNRVIDPATDPVITGPITTVAGTNLCIIMKVTIPPGTPLNSTDNTAITASFTYTNASPALVSSYTVRDLTTVGADTNSGLRLDKAVDKAAALPGATLTYTVTFTNDSIAALSNLKINDTTPAYTTFVSAACGAPLPSSLTACAITAPTAGQSGAIQWTFTGTLSPSQTGTVTFVVKIQ